MTTTNELVQHYADLLIFQYDGLDRAEATIKAQVTPIVMPQTGVQTITFSVMPVYGEMVLSWGGVETDPISAIGLSASTIQTALQAIAGLEDVTVTLTLNDDDTVTAEVTFEGVPPVAELLVLVSSTLDDGVDPITVTIAETDLTLPLAVQEAYNLDTAVGVQLDVLGKYVGVTRTAPGFYEQITLDDDDFRSLIRLAIIKNNAGSSLYEIQTLLTTWFPGAILVFDYQNMQMSYLVSTSVGSASLVQLFVTEKLLPRPMAVQIALLIYAPDIDKFFGFRTYLNAAFNATPFNSYTDYQTDWPWLSYANAIV